MLQVSGKNAHYQLKRIMGCIQRFNTIYYYSPIKSYGNNKYINNNNKKHCLRGKPDASGVRYNNYC